MKLGQSVNAGQTLAKIDSTALEDALKQATNVPLSVGERAREVLQIVDALGPITKPNMKSDLATAAALARAAIQGALANVEINLDSLQDKDFQAAARALAGALRSRDPYARDYSDANRGLPPTRLSPPTTRARYRSRMRWR